MSRCPPTCLGPPHLLEGVEARAGIEPAHKGFADLSLTTWVPRQHAPGWKRTALRRGGSDWSGRRDLNPRPSPWQGDALPLSYSRLVQIAVYRSSMAWSTAAVRLASRKAVQKGCRGRKDHSRRGPAYRVDPRSIQFVAHHRPPIGQHHDEQHQRRGGKALHDAGPYKRPHRVHAEKVEPDGCQRKQRNRRVELPGFAQRVVQPIAPSVVWHTS